MAIEVVPLTEGDIPGAIEVIQQAFADDPYFKWVFDQSKVCAARYHESKHLGYLSKKRIEILSGG